MAGRSGKRRGQCGYCGAEGPVSRDHVLPGALVARPRQSLITVPACDDCHTDEDSRDAELFAFQTAIDLRASGSTAARAIHGSLIKSVAHPRKRGWARRVFRSFSLSDAYTPAGVYVGRFPSYELDVRRLQRVAVRIIRGLYFHHWHHPVPASHDVHAFSADMVRRLPKETRDAAGWLLRFVLCEPPRSVGTDTLVYRLRRFPEDARSCVALLVFYTGVAYIGWILANDPVEADRQLEGRH